MYTRGIKITENFVEAVERYKNDRGLKSWTRALVELASAGLEAAGYAAPEPAQKWGGDRQNRKGDKND